MERFYISQPITGNSFIINQPKTIHKLLNVLRLKRGDQVIIFDSKENEFLAELSSVSKEALGFGVNKELDNKSEPAVRLHLYASLFKKARFEWMLEKCTEVGVYFFNPILGKRSVVEIKQIPERWRTILIETTQQCGRTHIPQIFDPVSLEQALQEARGEIIVAVESSTVNASLEKEQVLNKVTSTSKEISLFTGPEGGWTKEEVELFEKHKVNFLNLGDRILRAETAAVVCSALCIYK